MFVSKNSIGPVHSEAGRMGRGLEKLLRCRQKSLVGSMKYTVSRSVYIRKLLHIFASHAILI